MKDLINKEHSCMLWKDDDKDFSDFLLLKYAEVYRYSEKVLRLHVFSSRKLSQLRCRGLILNEEELDEPFTIVDVDSSNLEQIIQLGAFKKRPNLNGRWLKDKEQKLAHKIIPYNPDLKEA